ncbi:c-type cytochrome [Phyllobacterium ifriqiyense]|uniref:c-type cytochrome n=1 Tax=Phyllobacterium ifriqiyense TaxID=314238 RepID=UPI0033972D94
MWSASDVSLKKGRFIRAILAAFVLVTTPVHASDKSDVERGKALVEKRCSRCHSIGRTGDSHHPDAPASGHLRNAIH